MSVGYENGGKRDEMRGEHPADWDALKDDVGGIANVALERGRHFIDSARDQATGYVDRRKDDMAQSVTDLAHSLRESCRSFDDRPNIQAFVDSAAEGLEQFADEIRTRSFGEIFDEVESVMRRRPAAVAATTFAAGFLLARFIKSSAEGARYQGANRANRMSTGRPQSAGAVNRGAGSRTANV